MLDEARNHLGALRQRLRDPAYIDAVWLAAWRAQAQEHLAGLVGRRLPDDAARLRTDLARQIDEGAAQAVAAHSARYLEAAAEEHRAFLDGVESHPLTPRQREVILREEPNLLALAGAGAGKTSVVVGAAGLLIHTKAARPDQILLLAYNRKAARELETRIEARLGVRVAAHTFHKLGLDILSAVERRRPSLSPGATNPRDLSEQVEAIVHGLFRSRGRDMARFFLFYLRPLQPPHAFPDRAAYQRHLRTYEVRTLDREPVHSCEACVVADWLRCNGLRYTYRPPWPGGDRDPAGVPYRPDLYLPDHDVYIDVVVLDGEGKPPAFVDAATYRQRVAFLRELHDRRQTRRVEVSSADLAANRLARRLRQGLEIYGVPLQPLAPDVLQEVFAARGDVTLLVTLLTTFLQHARSGGWTPAALRERAGDSHRAQAFVALFGEVRRLYEESLRDGGLIDFDDMIGQATAYVEAGRFRSPFTHIIVDEFQDISRGRLRLLQALLDQRPGRRLLCVGDDWQAIYRFAGSDVYLMRALEGQVGAVRTVALDRTFRYHEGLAALSQHFISRNPAQLPKDLRAARPAEGPAAVILHDIAPALEAISAEAATADTPVSVLLLGRYRFLEPDLAAIRRDHPRLEVSFFTVHASKGLEADYVVVLGMVSGRLGFPSEIVDDPLLDMVLSLPEGCPNAEERRLFYVALTRARRRAFLVTDPRRPSAFIEELMGDDYRQWVAQP